MNRVDPGVALPFEVTYDTTNLFVAMLVYDVTSGSPVLADTIPMDHVINGVYVGIFTPAANKTYLIVKASFTDVTYSAFDSNRYPASESISTIVQSQASIAAAVWDQLRANHLLDGSFGQALQGVLTAQRAINLDNLDLPISSVADVSDVIVGTAEEMVELVGITEDIATEVVVGSTEEI
jgi:hypothetical protein